jgi:hypothetical protein
MTAREDDLRRRCNEIYVRHAQEAELETEAMREELGQITMRKPMPFVPPPLHDPEARQARPERAAAQFAALQPIDREVLGQLFLYGPSYDGSIASKVGRDRLRELNLIERGFGWSWLTRAGVEMALCAGQKIAHEQGIPVTVPDLWRKKQVR